ncbi:MAG: DUF4235 domain-containing protein [Sporichthyaceae bacterium]
MVKTLYKPVALLLGLLGGMIASKVVQTVWMRVGDENDIPPAPDQKEAPWKTVLLGAALQGAVYAIVKAVVKRGGAVGVEKATGTWPGKTMADVADAKAA